VAGSGCGPPHAAANSIVPITTSWRTNIAPYVVRRRHRIAPASRVEPGMGLQGDRHRRPERVRDASGFIEPPVIDAPLLFWVVV
jgi:hypothetical protein